ncbi:MAG: sugar transferase [Nitrospira sp.]
MGNFLLGLVGNLLAAEIGAWCRDLAQKIVYSTARKLPEEHQPRMLEEWSALLEDIPGDLSKLWIAISLCRKSSVLANECEQLIDEPFPSQIEMAFNRTKRFVDILMSISLLLLLVPELLLIALLIKLDSPGPIISRHVRIGLRGRPFQIWKFRTTVEDPEWLAPRWTQADYPRISSVGGWLRKTGFDTLPYLINVLRGEMSVVGPRPIRPVTMNYVGEIPPSSDLRYRVRPGITGLSQLKLPRVVSAGDAHRMVQYDLYYIRRLSFMFDAKILAQTQLFVLKEAATLLRRWLKNQHEA